MTPTVPMTEAATISNARILAAGATTVSAAQDRLAAWARTAAPGTTPPSAPVPAVWSVIRWWLAGKLAAEPDLVWSGSTTGEGSRRNKKAYILSFISLYVQFLGIRLSILTLLYIYDQANNTLFLSRTSDTHVKQMKISILNREWNEAVHANDPKWCYVTKVLLEKKFPLDRQQSIFLFSVYLAM